MSTTLNIQSFVDNNIRERTELGSAVTAASTSLTVKSTAGFAAGDVIYVGYPGREGCEKATIDTVTDGTMLALGSGLALPHSIYEPVMSVIGDTIRIYRAANLDGTVPPDADFTVIATRDIDPDQLSTYYTDSTGSSAYWYRFTYYNATGPTETALADSTAVRGDDFGHYASISEIRSEAGFENAYNLPDSTVDQQRRAAEADINSALAGHYTVPFTTVPDMIHTLTIRLAAAYLLQNAYGADSQLASSKLKEARSTLDALKSRSVILGDTAEGVTAAGSGISSWPDDSTTDARIIPDGVWEQF
jgi:phage gp36-like protein